MIYFVKRYSFLIKRKLFSKPETSLTRELHVVDNYTSLKVSVNLILCVYFNRTFWHTISHFWTAAQADVNFSCHFQQKLFIKAARLKASFNYFLLWQKFVIAQEPKVLNKKRQAIIIWIIGQICCYVVSSINNRKST